MRMNYALTLLMVLAGCSEAPWVGTYAATGQWKLSGPLEGDRTVGDAAADLLLDKLVSAVPCPSFLEDDLRDWLADSLREKVKSTVDATVPEDLAPGGKITKLLGVTLASVKLESTIVLEGDSDELEGNETVSAVEYVINSKPRRITAVELGGDEASISAEWKGEEPTSGKLSIEPHALTLRFGALVRKIMIDLVSATELTSLDAGLTSALGCPAIITAIGADSGLEIDLGVWSYTISASDMVALCNAAMEAAGKKAAGQFELDSKVEVGGTVSWAEVPATESVELKSGADFGGTVNVLPKAIAPKVSVSFTALRK